jgi:hypothetical protein
MTSTYNTYVTSQLDNTKLNKFMSRYTTGSMSVTSEQVTTFFQSLAQLKSQSYSFVIETDINTLKFMLVESMRKFLCDNFYNLRIVHIVNIPTEHYTAFGVGSSFSFLNQETHDAYLLCSNSGFFSTTKDYVEFSTYDMKTLSYSQLNRVLLDDMSKNKYSFCYSDYYFERPQFSQSKAKRPRVETNQQVKK